MNLGYDRTKSLKNEENFKSEGWWWNNRGVLLILALLKISGSRKKREMKLSIRGMKCIRKLYSSTIANIQISIIF